MITRRRLLRAAPGLLLPPWLAGLPGCGASGTGPAAAGSCAAADTSVASQPPRGLHASWTADPHTSRTVTWFTDGSDDPGTVIEYGPVDVGMDDCKRTQAALPFRAEGSAHATYGGYALTHIATATDLDGTRPLRYRVGSAQGWSPIRVLPAAPREAFRFCHFGDHAQTDASRAVLAGVQQRAPDFLIIAGDLAYANGEQPLWDSYFEMIEPLAAQLPVMSCPGNH